MKSYPGDTVAIQTRMTNLGYSEAMKHNKQPPFHLPVVYQDDHIALVNKPSGVVVFGHKNGGFGRQTVKSCLPYVLQSPRLGTMSILWNALPVHRLDRATSGLLVVAKTKPAMVDLSSQFKHRKVKKTYTAIVNGDIQERPESSISSREAKQLGVCIENTGSHDFRWQFVDEELDGQSAVTIWRTVDKSSLEYAWNNTIAMVELKPKTGRYHQLRRHMAWVYGCSIVGDKSYDGSGQAKLLRNEGLYLCSNRVTLQHPFYNTPSGRKEWESNSAKLLGEFGNGDGKFSFTQEDDGTVLIHSEIELPSKFKELMNKEQVDR
eukprot:scaffold693_cov200-Alexandrium_tamarense.AAC.88